MIRIRTGSRLHFGLFNVRHEETWTNLDGEPKVPARLYGGLGLMLEAPSVSLSLYPARTWSVEGPLAERVSGFVREYIQRCGDPDVPPHHFVVESAPPEHVGLGTGTQLGLAVAHSLTLATQRSIRPVEELARLVGRGKRSAIGVHGFELGGFLVEGGKSVQGSVAPLLSRVDFPQEWRILLLVPRRRQGRHGLEEREAFRHLQQGEIPSGVTETLCRLVLLGILPALIERDVDTFGEALYDYNLRAGSLFQRVQGGIFSDASVEELVRSLRRLGVKAVGQSSWGPTVFAILPERSQAERLAQRIQIELRLENYEIVLTAARNRGADAE